MKEFYITDDGIQLHAKLDMPEEKEKCPLVIVFHGLTGNMEERHITAVSSAMNEIGFATLRVELYGHGKSGGTFEQHNLMKWINNAMTVTDYAKTLDFVTDLYICGHSQGGLLTMLAAGMRADDFKAAIPMSPAIVIPDGARKGNMLGQPFDPEHIPDMVEWGDRHLSGNYLRAGQEACDRCRSGGKERHAVKQLHRYTIECTLREHSIVMNNRADCQRSALLLYHPSLFSISPRNFFTAAVTCSRCSS